MNWFNPERTAKIGITIQFMALVRCISEYFRLKAFHPGAIASGAAEPFITGSLIAAVCAWIAVTCFFLRSYRLSVTVTALTVVILFAYKLTL